MGVANGVSSTSGLDSGMERVIAAPLGDTVDATVERHLRRVFASWRILVAWGISRNGGGIVLQSTCVLKLGMEVEMVGGIVDVTAGKHFLHSVVLL